MHKNGVGYPIWINGQQYYTVAIRCRSLCYYRVTYIVMINAAFGAAVHLCVFMFFSYLACLVSLLDKHLLLLISDSVDLTLSSRPSRGADANQQKLVTVRSHRGLLRITDSLTVSEQ